MHLHYCWFLSEDRSQGQKKKTNRNLCNHLGKDGDRGHLILGAEALTKPFLLTLLPSEQAQLPPAPSTCQEQSLSASNRSSARCSLTGPERSDEVPVPKTPPLKEEVTTHGHPPWWDVYPISGFFWLPIQTLLDQYYLLGLSHHRPSSNIQAAKTINWDPQRMVNFAVSCSFPL